MTFGISTGAKPSLCTLIVYVAGIRSGMVKFPCSLVVVSRFCLVAMLVTVIAAPGTTASFGSTTVPLRVAVVDWPKEEGSKPQANRKTETTVGKRVRLYLI